MELMLDKSLLGYYNQDLVAKSGIQLLFNLSHEEGDVFQKLFLTKKSLLNQHNGNVVLENALDFFLADLTKQDLRKQVKQKKEKVIRTLKHIGKESARHGAKKIKAGSTVFVHSLTNQVFDTLIASARYKQFNVNVVDHTPHNLGFALSKKLKKSRVKVNLYPDLHLDQAVVNSDACFIGAHAITKNEAVVKTGTNMAVGAALDHHIPVYVCGHTWKYDNKKKTHKLVHHKPSKRSKFDPHTVYEHLPSNKITAYILEHGIYKPEHVVSEIKFFNRWV